MLAKDLLAVGACSAPCLLAANQTKHCRCVCNEEYHGYLAEAAVPEPSLSVMVSQCCVCSKTIRRAGRRYVVGDRFQAHEMCLHRKSTVGLHAEAHPDCPVEYHDVWDHQVFFAANQLEAERWLEV